jgi:hypothetical protein
MKLIQHTEWTYPGYLMTTQYGYITYREWLGFEAKRINRDGDRTTEIRKRVSKTEDGTEYDEMALFVDRVGVLSEKN